MISTILTISCSAAERRVGDYQKAGVADGASGKHKHELAFDADF